MLIKTLAGNEGARTNFLRACLSKLGLEVNEEASPIPSLSSIHLSSMDRAQVSELLFSLEDVIVKEDKEEYIRAENDVFHIVRRESRWSVGALKKSLPTDEEGENKAPASRPIDADNPVKRVLPHEQGWPDNKETPSFHHNIFYSSLKGFHKIEPDAGEWGKLFMYGEVVTSTNTLLEK